MPTSSSPQSPPLRGLEIGFPETPRAGSVRSRSPLAALGFLLFVALGCGGDIESRMAEVRALQDVGQFTASIEELREILVSVPDLPEASYRLGVALVQTGERSRAIWSLQKASESSEYAVPAGSLLATIYLTNQDYEEALNVIDRVLEIEPDRQAALLSRAKANIGAKNFDIALADSVHLIELFPDDYTAHAVHATALVDAGKLEEAEIVHDRLKTMSAESGDPDTEARGCLAPALFAKDQLKDIEKATALYEDCMTKFPNKGFVLTQVTEFYDGIGRDDRSTEIFRKAIEDSPENLGLRSSLANRLRGRGQTEEAESVFVEAADTFGSAQAWNMLAGFYRMTDQPQQALDAIDKVIELSGNARDPIRFAQADLLVDLGELDRAEEIADSLGEPTYATLIKGRVLMSRGDAAGALEAFDKGIRSWPNNAAARYLAGLAARDLGLFDRAISELRESVRADQTATDAAVVLSRIYFDRGDHNSALTFANLFIKGRPQADQTPALRIAARSMTAQKRYPNARRSAELLGRLPGGELASLVELARIERAAQGPAAAIEVLEGTEIDFLTEESEEILRLLADNYIELERPGDALAKVDAALATRPDAASLHELRATSLARLDRRDEALESFRRATELDPEHAPAFGGLATLTAIGGQSGEAIELFDRASALAPDNVDYAYSAAQLALAAGDLDGAAERLRGVVRRSASHAGARNDLAWILTERAGDLDLALRLSKEARRLSATANNLDTLGWVHLKRGEAEAAVSVLEKATALEPDAPSIRYHLALALEEVGQPARAKDMLQAALDAGAFPEVEDARKKLEQFSQL